MKFRIFGTVFVLAILLAAYMLTMQGSDPQVHPSLPQNQIQDQDSNLRTLKIN